MSFYNEASSLSAPLGRPVGYGTTASANLRPAMPSSRHSNYIVHQVLPTDTIQGIALKYDVTVEELRRANKLWANDSVWLRATLLVPAKVGDDRGVTYGSAAAAVSTAAASGGTTVAGASASGDSSDFLSRLDSSVQAARSHLATVAATSETKENVLQTFSEADNLNVADRRLTSRRGSLYKDIRETPEPVVRRSVQDRLDRVQDELFQL